MDKKENLSLKLASDNIEVAQMMPLSIEYVSIDDVYPNEYNPNTHSAESFDLLCKSILYFGFTMPIVVNRPTMQIVDGENRFRAASVLGYKLIPVCFVDFDDEKLRYATIMHNMARGTDNKEMMDRLCGELDTKFGNKSDHVLLKDRKN